MCKEEEEPDIFEKAFGLVYVYRQKLIDNEEYEEVIALDKLIAYVKKVLSE